MTAPHVAQKGPYRVDVTGGKTLWWCACGLSRNQPFCDGSHKATPFTPVAYTPADDATVFFCGCKHSANKPLCDGTHRTL